MFVCVVLTCQYSDTLGSYLISMSFVIYHRSGAVLYICSCTHAPKALPVPPHDDPQSHHILFGILLSIIILTVHLVMYMYSRRPKQVNSLHLQVIVHEKPTKGTYHYEFFLDSQDFKCWWFTSNRWINHNTHIQTCPTDSPSHVQSSRFSVWMSNAILSLNALFGLIT